MSDLHLRSLLGRFERQLVIEALRRAGGGGSKEAARLLGISPSNLSYFVRKHALPYRARQRSVVTEFEAPDEALRRG
jgi:transcriptional regulator with GAF, ATPase, and Fis domain